VTVKLEPPVPVYWVYITAWATPDGIVQFRDDIYQRDGLGSVASDSMQPSQLLKEEEALSSPHPQAQPGVNRTALPAQTLPAMDEQ
jgi:hypothetical protein